MPTANPRINVTLPPEQYELVSRLAKMQRRSRSAVLLELLETVLPVLERVAVVGEAAQRAHAQAREGLRESVERAEATILPKLAEALEQADWLLEEQVRLVQDSAHRSTPQEAGGARRGGVRGPRPVTRGPGRGAGRPRKVRQAPVSRPVSTKKVRR